ncbi:hypothetical protein FB446DRAFT_320595 [Lentinula raphanica]|nr:hypothetical protein FB446DRAFT_320595 [Lentinula raphanica]
MHPELVLKPGTYHLINLQSHTALDLSEGDGRSFIGWTQHTNANQRFVFTPLGHGGGYLIQSAWNGNYATVEDGIGTGVSVVGTGFPATWALEKIDSFGSEDREGGDGDGKEKGDTFFRIRWPNSHYVMDLEGYGSDQDGTRIQLAYEQSPAHPCQIWRFEEVESSVDIAGLDTILAPNDIIFDPKSISDSDSEEEESQYSSSDFDSEDDSSDDEFHDASEDGLDLEGIVDFPGHTDTVGVIKAISRVDDVDSKDSEKYRKRLQKSWSNSMTVTRTTSTVCSVSKGALSTGKK